MLSLFLLFIFLSSEVDFPKMSFLMVSESMTDEIADEAEKQFDEMKDQLKQSCHQMYKDSKFCEDYIDSFQSYKYSNGKNIDYKMTQISTKTDFLFLIDLSQEQHTINLNKLQSQMSVFVTALYFDDTDLNKNIQKFLQKMIDSKFDGSEKSIYKFGQELEFHHTKKPKVSIPLNFVGHIKDKVSFLTIVNGFLSFKGNLDCHSAYFLNCYFDDKSDSIETIFLIVDPNTHNRLEKMKFRVNQYSIIEIVLSKYNYQISYGSDEWIVYRSSSDDFYKPRWTIPYNYANVFNLLVYTFYVKIDVVDKHRAKYSDINITVMEEQLQSSSPFPMEKDIIQVVSTNNWNGISNKPKLTLTINETKFDYDDSKLDLPLQVESLYSYQPKSTDKKKKVNVGMIVGIVVACVAVIIIIVVIIVLVNRKKKGKIENSSNEGIKSSQRNSNKNAINRNQNRNQQNQAPDYPPQAYFDPQQQYGVPFQPCLFIPPQQPQQSYFTPQQIFGYPDQLTVNQQMPQPYPQNPYQPPIQGYIPNYGYPNQAPTS